MIPAIEARGLRRSFGAIRALDGVDLRVEPGQIAGYVGPNGSGKTTTMRALLGLLRLESGELRIFGHDVASRFAEVAPLVGAVFEQDSLHADLTVRETLVLYARLYGVPRSRADEALDLMALAGHADVRVKTLSKGLSRRLAFGRAILHAPQLLLLDEPFDGIDTETLRHVRTLLRRLAGRGAAVLLTSHDLHEVEQLAGRVFILDHGRVVAEGPPAELARGFPTLEDAYIAQLEAVR